MNDARLTDLSLELHRGNTALWFGPDSHKLSGADASVIAGIPWTAIWTETKDSRFATLLHRNWENNPENVLKRRFIQEVPDRLETSLGTYYSFSEFCPIFYLNGKDESFALLPLREQRRARDEKVDQLNRLNGGVLFVSGFDQPADVANRILDEFTSASEELRVIVFDASQHVTEIIAKQIGAQRRSVLTRVTCESDSLTSVLLKIAELQKESPPAEPSIKVGSQHFSLVSLLSAKLDPPLDQFFDIIQSLDIAPPQASEDRNALRDALVRGRTPVWRAFAHNLQWPRNQKYVDEVLSHMSAMHQKGTSSVVCINLVAERGSGLTTLLQEIAFRTAQSGSPTVLHRSDAYNDDYDSLRLFFERIDAESSRRGSHRPVPTIVFDSIDSAEDAMENLRHFPKRLASDGRTALIIRGISVRAGQLADEAFRADVSVTPAKDKVEEVWLGSILAATLSSDELRSLSNWATTHWDTIPKDSLVPTIHEWGSDWTGDTTECPPLLICLYFILKGHLSAAADIGRHLFHRVEHLFQLQDALTASTGITSDANKPLSSDEIMMACQMLQHSFERSPSHDKPLIERRPSHHIYFDVLSILSALGALRVGIPRSALAGLCGIEADALTRILIDFDHADLVSTDVAPTQHFLAPAAYYDAADRIGLRHPAYGRLLLEWVQSDEALHLVDALPLNCWTQRILDALKYRGLGPYPIWLLVPLFQSMRPSSAQVRFVEEVSSRFLRIQRLKGSAYHKWMFAQSPTGEDNSELVYDVLEQVPEEVARQRSGILHTRGITRYKSCRHWTVPIAQYRKRYEQAWTDFDLALSRAEVEMQGESPATILTSKGLSYMFRSNLERTRPDGASSIAADTDAKALACFREALGRRRDNSYASYGLAEFLISSCERLLTQNSASELSSDVAKQYVEQVSEACELLQNEPSEAFRSDWEQLWKRLIQLLGNKSADAAINQLKTAGDEIGFALEALRLLNGRIPTEPISDEGEVEELEQAHTVLEAANKLVTTRSDLASLLRYAIYSSHPARLISVDYDHRYLLVRKLKDTVYIRVPLWLFDFGMLALQARDLDEGLWAFRELRKGKKFFEVPLERTTYLSKPGEPVKREVGIIRVIRIDPDGKGWGKLDSPAGFTDSIPFSVADFKKQTHNLQPGRAMTCYIRIRPSGPSAEPT